MLNVCEQYLCTGCGACSCICPKHCITMEENEHGFFFPSIDEKKCIDCKKCKTNCPQNRMSVLAEPIQVWAAWNRNQSERRSSASGGVASGLYSYAIDNGFIVSGVEMGVGFVARHSLAFSKEDLYRFKSSKYVQSIAFGVFAEIKMHLESGYNVLFIGTPCQVDGLKSYLNKRYEGLVTVDLVCHGVPSSRYLREHACSVTKCNENQSVVSFRDVEGWKFKVIENGKTIYEEDAQFDLYYQAFLSALTYRDCCYHCKYAQTNRVGDITIGDFWGLGKKAPVNYPIEKVSLVLTNTEKGTKFFDQCDSYFFRDSRSLDEGITDNEQLQHASIPHRKRKDFINRYGKLGFDKAVEGVLAAEIRKSRRTELYRKIRYKVKTLIEKK